MPSKPLVQSPFDTYFDSNDPVYGQQGRGAPTFLDGQQSRRRLAGFNLNSINRAASTVEYCDTSMTPRTAEVQVIHL